MKILHLSDLHLNRAWLNWAEAQAARYDLVCVSGDLLDMFSRKGHFGGVISIKKWADSFLGNLALCSGNHDGSSPERIPDTGLLAMLTGEDRREAEKLLLLERWMDALDRPHIITDNRTKLLDTAFGPVVVTTFPYNFQEWWEPRTDLWKAGARLRRETKAPWIVLYHEPPQGSLVGGFYGSAGLTGMIEIFQPTLLLSGHHHLQPYRGNFAERMGATWCFNPGVPSDIDAAKAEKPNHISLDLKEGAASWYFTPPNKTYQEKLILSLGL